MQHCQIAIVYLAIKERQIAIAYLAIRECQIASNYSATKESQMVSNHSAAMLVMSSSQTRGYMLHTVLHLLKAY